MVFTHKVAHWGNAVLNHKEKNEQTAKWFLNYDLNIQNADQETIKRVVSEYDLIFCNHFVETSHFVNFLNTNRLASDQKDDFFYYLFLFVKQFYPNDEILKNINDIPSLTELFSNYYKRMNEMISEFYETTSLECVKSNIDEIHKIYKFYGIIEDFMIRYYGYSVKGVSRQKYIITACSNCNKKFIDELEEGYTLIRLQKIYLVNGDNPYYKFLPVLPTKDVGFPIEEYIETSSEDNTLEHKQLLKIQ